MLSADGDAKLTGFTGTGTPSDDDRALAALLETLGASATAAADETGVTAVLPSVPRSGRRRIGLALAALALVSAGIGAALLATSGESKPAGATTGPASVATSTRSTQEPVIAPPATTAEETTTGTTTAPAPATTAAPTTALPTTAPAPPTEPAPTTEPPATEPAPTTEPPPETTEPPPATTTTPTATG
jgi:hypothetical protein